MKYPCLPSQVTQFLQRIAEFVSYLTISYPYISLQRIGTKAERVEGSEPIEPELLRGGFIGNARLTILSNLINRRSIFNNNLSAANEIVENLDRPSSRPLSRGLGASVDGQCKFNVLFQLMHDTILNESSVILA